MGRRCGCVTSRISRLRNIKLAITRTDIIVLLLSIFIQSAVRIGVNLNTLCVPTEDSEAPTVAGTDSLLHTRSSVPISVRMEMDVGRRGDGEGRIHVVDAIRASIGATLAVAHSVWWILILVQVRTNSDINSCLSITRGSCKNVSVACEFTMWGKVVRKVHL